jgi:hypothetical protein
VAFLLGGRKKATANLWEYSLKKNPTNSFRCGIAISSVHLRTRLKVLTQSMRRELNSGEAVGEHGRSTFKNWDSDGFDRQPS